MHELRERARPIPFWAHFYQGNFNPDSIGQKVHPKNGPKRGPRFSGPFLMLLNCHPAHYTAPLGEGEVAVRSGSSGFSSLGIVVWFVLDESTAAPVDEHMQHCKRGIAQCNNTGKTKHTEPLTHGISSALYLKAYRHSSSSLASEK